MHALEPGHLLETFGYAGLFFIVYAESGLLFGFFFPGDSLLLTAGLFAQRGNFDIRVVVALTFAGAVLGDNTGYWFGRKVGPPLFRREATFLFRKKNLLAAKAFYDAHGGKAIVLARFMPFIRTFAPIVAGAVEMPYARYVPFSVGGGMLWAIGLPLAGYWLAGIIPPRYFSMLVMAVIVVSVMPTAIHVWRENRRAIAGWVRARLPGR